MADILLDKNGNIHNNLVLAIQMGKIDGAKYIWKFGYSGLNLLNLPNTVWDHNTGVYPYHLGYGVNAKQIDITSTIPLSDDGLPILVEGLDADGYEQIEEVVIGGTSVKLFSRVFRMTNNNGTLIAGETSAYVIGTANIVAHIDNNAQSTLMAIYTVPKGYTAFLEKGIVSVGSGKEGVVDYITRALGGVFEIRERLAIYQNQIEANRPYLPIAELTDIEVRYKPAQANTSISATFGLILLNNKIHNL